ncbi:MAG: FliH/SctL family protein [Allosphingosinicella sp.]|uniref:FliH/SctL family protein n=1 Tax=Allosphingosinicella sp. TaxID=2823234 RepID=UPI00392D02F7
MSNLWGRDSAAAAASVGSFVIRRGVADFTPFGGEGPRPGNDDAPPPSAEEELRQLQSEAFAQGYEEGRRTVEAEVAAERDAVARLAESLETLRPEPTNALALLLAETVDRLVREVVGAVDIDPVTLLARAKAAAALIGDNVEPSKLRCHPDDAELLAGAALDVPIAPDPALERGTLILETGHGWVEDGPAVRLERLRAELDRMGAPR